MLLSDVCLSVAYVGPKVENREALGDQNWHRDRPRHTRDSDTTFKVKRSNVKVTGAGAYCGGLPHSLLPMSAVD